MQRLPGETTKDMWDRWNSFNTKSDPWTEIPASMAATALTMTEYALIGELLARGGAALSSHWTCGQGRNKTKAAVPPFAAIWAKDLLAGAPQHVVDLFAKHRRAKLVVGFYQLKWVRECFNEATKILLERTE